MPTTLEVLGVVCASIDICRVYMDQQFVILNSDEVQQKYARARLQIPVEFKTEDDFQKRARGAAAIVRVQELDLCSSMVLVSGHPPAFYADMLSLL